MNLLDLPLELLRAVLAGAMLARTLKRAMRLRLVNKLFSSEVIRMLSELRMLDTSDICVDLTGSAGKAYFSHRLLSKDPVLSPRLDNVRRIASRLAQEDGEIDDTYRARYAEYINKLSSLLITDSYLSFQSAFGMHERTSGIDMLDYDFLSAAAYTGHLSLVRELCQNEENTRERMGGTFGSPYKCAAFGGHIDVIDFLLKTADLHGRNAKAICVVSMLSVASNAGALHTVQHLLASPWKPNLYHFPGQPLMRNKGQLYESFHYAMSGPNLEIFKTLRRFKETSLSREKTLSEEELGAIFLHCCIGGHMGPAVHALELGAHIDGYQGHLSPLSVCEHTDMMKLLLQRGAKISESNAEIIKAASRGRFAMVKLLVEYGASVSTWIRLPIVSAIELEHDEMFKFLAEHGGLEGGDAGKLAAKRAREQGLQSMITLLEEYGVSVDA